MLWPLYCISLLVILLCCLYMYLHVSLLPPPSLSLAVVKQFQSYVDPEESSGPVGTEEEGVALPLGETTLICNIGIPIIVVCCKVSFYAVYVQVCVCVCVVVKILRFCVYVT